MISLGTRATPGTERLIRVWRPATADREELARMFERCTLETRYRRFHGPVKAIPERYLADALSGDGYAAAAGPAPAIGPGKIGTAIAGNKGTAASAEPVDNGAQICQHHCPVAHVAAEFPQLCEAETEAFGRLLGTPVRRLATIAHGDGICTTHVTCTSRATTPTGPEGSDI